MEREPILEIRQYTDPYCTWCWGSEPVMRHVEEVYGAQVRSTFCMGGLVEDISRFYDPLNKIGGPEMMLQVAEHWEEASHRHGMPVEASVFTDPENGFRSTWPANIAWEAANLQDPARADRFLRRLREGAAAEHRFIHRREVQLELAAECGLDTGRMSADLDSGAAEAAFREDLAECRERHVTGFPSFLLSDPQGEELMFFGFTPFGRMEELMHRVAGSRLQARKIVADGDSILDFIRRRGKAAGAEIAEVFSLSKDELDGWIDLLAGKGLVRRQAAGNGWFCLPIPQ